MATSSAPGDGVDLPEIMAAMDDDGAAKRLVIADVSVEDAWLSMREAAAVTLSKWR